MPIPTNKIRKPAACFILWVAERDSIDVRDGYRKRKSKKQGPKAFEFNQNALQWQNQSMWTTPIVRKKR